MRWPAPTTAQQLRQILANQQTILAQLRAINGKETTIMSTLADLQTALDDQAAKLAALQTTVTDLDAREAAEGPSIPQALLDSTVAAVQASNTAVDAVAAHLATMDPPAGP